MPAPDRATGLLDKPDQVWFTLIVIVKNISEAKTQLSALLEKVQKGDEVLIAKAGKPIAKLTGYSGAAAPRKPGVLKGKIKISPDFDELPEDIAEAFGAKGT